MKTTLNVILIIYLCSITFSSIRSKTVRNKFQKKSDAPENGKSFYLKNMDFEYLCYDFKENKFVYSIKPQGQIKRALISFQGRVKRYQDKKFRPIISAELDRVQVKGATQMLKTYTGIYPTLSAKNGRQSIKKYLLEPFSRVQFFSRYGFALTLMKLRKKSKNKEMFMTNLFLLMTGENFYGREGYVLRFMNKGYFTKDEKNNDFITERNYEMSQGRRTGLHAKYFHQFVKAN